METDVFLSKLPQIRRSEMHTVELVVYHRLSQRRTSSSPLTLHGDKLVPVDQSPTHRTGFKTQKTIPRTQATRTEKMTARRFHRFRELERANPTLIEVRVCGVSSLRGTNWRLWQSSLERQWSVEGRWGGDWQWSTHFRLIRLPVAGSKPFKQPVRG